VEQSPQPMWNSSKYSATTSDYSGNYRKPYL